MNKSTTQTKISIIIPTQSRIQLLPAIINCYNKQTWGNKELLILDSTNNGKQAISRLQKIHQNVNLWHTNRTCSIGEKRNLLIQKASGELIAHFDDDDYYAPTYIETLAMNLIKSNADLIKLSGWFCFHEESQTLGYWDTTRKDLPQTIFTGSQKPSHQKERFRNSDFDSFISGYGFSYLFRKKVWLDLAKFEHINLGEDSRFHDEIVAKNGSVKYLKDNEGIALHIIHSQNTSKCFPNFLIPHWLAPKNFSKVTKTSETKKTSEVNKQSQKAPIKNQNKHKISDNHPLVSICTITYNRKRFIPLLLKCVERQSYPLDRLEWIIIDDSDAYQEPLDITTGTKLKIRYKKLKNRIPLGMKRNLSHKLCRGDYIVYMDDDDYYYPERVAHAIDTLKRSKKPLAGCTNLLIYFSHDDQIWIAGPYGNNHATAGTFAMTKDFADQHFYENSTTCNEEKIFLNNYTIPIAQLEPTKTMICISHDSNTFDKRRMRKNGPTKKIRPIEAKASEQLKIRLHQAGYGNTYSQQEKSDEIKKHKPAITLVCGAWGSGTSALCAIINALGVYAGKNFYRTGDPRTPNSFELSSFNTLVQELVDETTLQKKQTSQITLDKIQSFSQQLLFQRKDLNSPTIQLLKTPACSAILGELNEVFSIKLIVCLRDLDSIEQSRLRRGWDKHLGRSGGEKIYSQINSFISKTNLPYIKVHYNDVKNEYRCKELIKTLSDFLGIAPSLEQTKNALKSVARKP